MTYFCPLEAAAFSLTLTTAVEQYINSLSFHRERQDHDSTQNSPFGAPRKGLTPPAIVPHITGLGEFLSCD